MTETPLDICKVCLQERNIRKLEEITDLQWEEHYYDITNSILNPNIQYQALFVLKKPIREELSRICLPHEWLLIGEDILDIQINSSYCPYYKCSYQQDKDRLIIDIPKSLFHNFDSMYLLANIQEVWKSKLIPFNKFLNRLNIDDFKESDINTRYLYKAFIQRKFFRRKKYIFHFLIENDPFEKIDLVDMWVKIPNICKLEEKDVFFSENMEDIFNKVDISYLDILNKRKIQKITGKKRKKLSNDKLRENSKTKQEGISNSLKKLVSMSYQSSKVDHDIYHKRFEDLKGFLLFRFKIKFKFEILIWFYLPIIFCIMQLTLSICSMFFYQSLITILPEFDSWTFFIFSINIFVLLLVSLNWGSIKLLSLFKPKIFRIYFTILLISIVILIISLIWRSILIPILTNTLN